MLGRSSEWRWMEGVFIIVGNADILLVGHFKVNEEVGE